MLCLKFCQHRKHYEEFPFIYKAEVTNCLIKLPEVHNLTSGKLFCSCYEACTVWVGAITGGGVAVWGTGGAWHPGTHLCAHPPLPPPPPLLSPSCPYDTHLCFHLLAHRHRQLPAPPLSAPPGWLWPARPGPGRPPRAYCAPWRWPSWLCFVFNTAGDFFCWLYFHDLFAAIIIFILLSIHFFACVIVVLSLQIYF